MKDIALARDALRDGDLALAARLLKRVLAAQPRHAAANELMGYVEANRGNRERALECLRTATRAQGASASAWYSLGLMFFQEGRLDDAEAAFRSALRIDAGMFEALHDLGRVLHEEGNPAEAVEYLQRAGASNPGSFEVRHNLGRSLHALGRYADALAQYDAALERNPASPETWLNRGEALHDLGRLDSAIDSYSKAQALRPDYPEARANEGLARLAAGDFARGWAAYEARWRGKGAQKIRHGHIPRWDGATPVAGKKILVWWEQGFGDTIQFCRFIPILLERGAEVIFEVQEDLKPLLGLNLPCRVVSSGDAEIACDYQIPVLSLPLAFRVGLENVPANVPYLEAPRDKVESWRQRIQRDGSRPKVAITCSGLKSYKHEMRRRVGLEDLAPLASHAHLFLVQKEVIDEDRAVLDRGSLGVDYLGNEIVDFRDGAGIIANMDLVVSIDTSLTHLAGAMAKPVWLMLADVPDWRWMLDRHDSPWYPTARLFRQKQPGDWAGVIADVIAALENFQPEPLPCSS